MNEIEKTDNEQLILKAAEQEFLTKGYDGARTTSIAQKAGVSHAMLHYYFRTKKQLFDRIIEKTVETFKEAILAALGNPNMLFVERLKDGIASQFDIMVANPLLPRFFLNATISSPELYDLLYERIASFVKVLIVDLQKEADAAAERGEIEKTNIQVLLITIMSLNVFPFIAYQFIGPVMGEMNPDREKFFAERKAENIELIMKRIIKH